MFYAIIDIFWVFFWTIFCAWLVFIRLSPTRVAILGRQKPIWQWVPKWQQLAFWLDLQQSMQTSSPQTLAVGSRRRADT